MSYRFLDSALAELNDAASFYDRREAGLGIEFLSEVDDAISLILQFPEAWSPASMNCRRCVVRKFPYFLIYTILADREILIVSVFHQSREPDTWRDRL